MLIVFIGSGGKVLLKILPVDHSLVLMMASPISTVISPIRSDLTNIFAARKDFIISTPVFSHGAKIFITVSLYMIIDKNNKK